MKAHAAAVSVSKYFIGLISGTSTDGVDAALVEFAPAPRLHHSHFLPYPDALRTQLLALAGGRYEGDPIDQLGTLDHKLGELFAHAAIALLKNAGLESVAVRAIGSHGQTVRHHPGTAHPFSLQIADPNIIAVRTGITTVADFRRRDLALDGEGAPLVPAFHADVFSDTRETRAVVNIGGIANLTFLPASNGNVIGFDTGPGNVLMDWWSREHLHAPFDKNGEFAASGKVNSGLLEALLTDDYFQRLPPKSTGPEHFSPAWFLQKAENFTLPPPDVMATLCELTACSIATSVTACVPRTQRVLLCGGGGHNAHLRTRLATRLLTCELQSTADFGISPDMVEATAFAWLARETLAGRPGNLPTVTGACAPAVLGAVYPA